jgi:transposase-like protein
MSDLEQLVRASRLYYELGETQNAIAEQLGVTRPQVSRLLKRARAEGSSRSGSSTDRPSRARPATSCADLRPRCRPSRPDHRRA